jgi:hypothetical protein
MVARYEEVSSLFVSRGEREEDFAGGGKLGCHHRNTRPVISQPRNIQWGMPSGDRNVKTRVVETVVMWSKNQAVCQKERARVVPSLAP